MLRGRMKDPDSVRFGDAWQSSDAGTPIACGYYNGKNSFGAYGGSKRFIAGSELLETEEDGIASFESDWLRVCRK